MLWLAASLFLKSEKKKSAAGSFSFTTGALLQLVNPKVILYGITIFAVFSNTLAANSLSVFIGSLVLSCVGFVSVLTWCTVGSFLTRFLGDKRNLLIFNLILAALLLYSAFSIILE
jgi:threonine/homoserine/homoserine lactone efflux protein